MTTATLSPAAPPVIPPVIIDTDPGTDDALALWLALAPPSLDVRAVTVGGGNTGLDRTLRNAGAIVALAGASAPVHAGADRPLLGRYEFAPHVHGEDGLGGVRLPDGPPPAPGLAADAIRAALRDAPAPVTLVGLGPVTNLALALATEPALADNVAEIVLMSGAEREGNVTPAAEFNAWNDPEALAVLLASGRRCVFATLDLTGQALASPARIAAMRAAGTGRCLDAACRILEAGRPHPKHAGGLPIHDACAIAWLLAPGLFRGRDCHAAVDLGPGPDRGRTVFDRWNRLRRPPNALLLEEIDADGFFALLARRLGALP